MIPNICPELRTVPRRGVILSALLAITGSTALSAQERKSVEVGAGLAVATGFHGRHGALAPYARIGLVQKRSATVSYRLDVEGMRFPSESPPTDDLNPLGAISVLGVAVSGIFSSTSKPVAPYGIVGLSGHGIHNAAPDTYPGGMIGMRTGVGLRCECRTANIFVEATLQIPLAGFLGGSSKAGTFIPLQFGVRF